MGNAQKVLDTVERKLKAFELRKAGKTYDEIARELGYSNRGAAQKAVMGTMRKLLSEPAEEVRKMELARLDTMFADLWNARARTNDKGDPTTVDRLLRIMERRAKLLGLDAPTKISPTDPTGEREYDSSELFSKLLPELAGNGETGTPEQTDAD
jgi:hypothetical protein